MLSTESPDNLSERDYLHRYVLNNRVGAPGSMAPILEKLRTIVAFDDYCISGLDFDDYRVGAGIFLASSLPERFLREYADNQLIKKDPLAELISPERTVAQWQGVSGKPAACPVEDLLRRYHVAPRTVISLWSGGRLYGGVMVTREKPFTSEELRILELFAEPIHAEAAAPVIAMANERLGLTHGQVRCLASAADGKSSAEIAEETGYTTETVNFYLKAAIKKLSSANRTQAVVSAIRRRII